MGRYIAHLRRKFKAKRDAEALAPPVELEELERDLAAERATKSRAIACAAAEKQARAELRRSQKAAALACGPDASGRERTALRIAGVVAISATMGIRTRGVSIRRAPGSQTHDLWHADVDFDVPKSSYYINDPTTPADVDAAHAMRALAPNVAEALFFEAEGADFADGKNLQTALSLARSYMRKTCGCGVPEDEAQNMSHSLLEAFKTATANRLWLLRDELAQISYLLMQRRRVSRSECDSLLDKIYAEHEEHFRDKRKLELFRPQRDRR